MNIKVETSQPFVVELEELAYRNHYRQSVREVTKTVECMIPYIVAIFPQVTEVRWFDTRVGQPHYIKVTDDNRSGLKLAY